MSFEGHFRALGHVGACLRRGLESRNVPCLDDGRDSFKLILGKVGAREFAKEVDIGGAYICATSAFVDGYSWALEQCRNAWMISEGGPNEGFMWDVRCSGLS